jgi:hypothetical protein
MKNAYEELIKELQPDETVEAIVFGDWGWEGYAEPKDKPVSECKKGIILTLEEAKPIMQSWSFFGGYGSPECYATYVWTNQRIIWVTQYDGSTNLDSAPRHPIGKKPYMPGA